MELLIQAGQAMTVTTAVADGILAEAAVIGKAAATAGAAAVGIVVVTVAAGIAAAAIAAAGKNGAIHG